MRETKKQLESKLRKLTRELQDERDTHKSLYNRYDQCQDRKKLAARYLQTLRVMLDYVEGTVTTNDFDRLLDVLEEDHYPEGF